MENQDANRDAVIGCLKGRIATISTSRNGKPFLFLISLT